MWISIGVLVMISIVIFLFSNMKKESLEKEIHNITEEYSQYKENVEKKLEKYKIIDKLFGINYYKEYDNVISFFNELSEYKNNKKITLIKKGYEFEKFANDNYYPNIINIFNEPLKSIIVEYIELLKWYPILKNNYENDHNFLQYQTNVLIKINSIAEKILNHNNSLNLENIISEIESDCPMFLRIILFEYLIKSNFNKEILLEKIRNVENKIKETESFLKESSVGNSVPKISFEEQNKYERPFGANPEYWDELISIIPTSKNSTVEVPNWDDPELYFFNDGKIPVAFYRHSSTLFRVFSEKKINSFKI